MSISASWHDGVAHSAAAAGLAELQIQCTIILCLELDVAATPLIFSPRSLLPVQHNVWTKSVHQNWDLQMLVQVVQRCLQLAPQLLRAWEAVHHTQNG